MKRLKGGLYVALFALICLGTVSFLFRFCASATPLMGYLEWTAYEIVDQEGTPHPFDPYEGSFPWDWREGEVIRLTGHLPKAEELPAFYEDGYLLFEYAGMDLTLLVDGEIYLHMLAPDRGQDMIWQQVQLPFPAGDAGKELTMLCVPLNPEACQIPLYARFTSYAANVRFYTSSANSGALPAGAYALAFVLICAIFLIGLISGSPDWSLPALALAAAASAVWQLCNNSGPGFLPAWLYALLLRPLFPLVLIAPLLLYLCLNRNRASWRYLGRITACVAPALALWYLFLYLRGDPMAANIQGMVLAVLSGLPCNLLYYLSIYLTAACTSIAAYTFLRTQLRSQAEASSLALQSRLAVENYHQMEQNLRGTALLRHEWKNQVAALHLMALQKNYAELERTLEQMDSRLCLISTTRYSDNFTVNVILQSAAARATSLGVSFNASAPIPEKLGINESDLCSLLINMLDNALEAASKAEECREVHMALKVSQGFLSIKCDNTYAGSLSVDKSGQFRSTKLSPEDHGLGLTQMRRIAEKYSGILDVTYTESRFTVQTALSMNP